MLVVWPVLGYLDVVLLAMLRTRSSLIIHDPRPLVSATGYGAISRALARIFKNHVEIIVHSEQAAAVVRREAPTFTLTTLPHPMLEPVATDRPASELPTVQVFGQYKPDRDLDALSSIATGLQGLANFAIDGRGWPELEGWTVRNRFVPEEEVDDLIARSAVVVIPYRHFFQSGVAIRALESAVPFVGPRDSSLSDLVGTSSSWLASSSDTKSWFRAVDNALGATRDGSVQAGKTWRIKSIDEWKSWSSK